MQKGEVTCVEPVQRGSVSAGVHHTSPEIWRQVWVASQLKRAATKSQVHMTQSLASQNCCWVDVHRGSGLSPIAQIAPQESDTTQWFPDVHACSAIG